MASRHPGCKAPNWKPPCACSGSPAEPKEGSIQGEEEGSEDIHVSATLHAWIAVFKHPLTLKDFPTSSSNSSSVRDSQAAIEAMVAGIRDVWSQAP